MPAIKEHNKKADIHKNQLFPYRNRWRTSQSENWGTDSTQIFSKLMYDLDLAGRGTQQASSVLFVTFQITEKSLHKISPI